MKSTNFFTIIVFLVGIQLIFSCKKETSCEACRERNTPPVAVAGPDQIIVLPADSVLLDGSASYDQDGTIVEWQWRKVEGPGTFSIVNSSAARTKVTFLITGTYRFELTIKDNSGALAKDTMEVKVNAIQSGNHAPVANAGADQTITLPNNSIILDGRNSSDPDNNISVYQWIKVQGPSSFVIHNPNGIQSQVTALVDGVYLFELIVTDATGLVDNDYVQIIVNQQNSNPVPCGTNCGKIVFVSDRDNNLEIYTCDADGSNVTRLTHNSVADGDPAWSPDGTKIAFIRFTDINNLFGDLYIMNADGSNVVQKTTMGRAAYPSWSPDGSKIAFNYDWNSSFRVLDLSTGSITSFPVSGSSVRPIPAWSPDGSKIAYCCDWHAWDFVSDIFTISPSGTGITTLTPVFYNDFNYWKPSWSPDGTRFAVTLHSLADPFSESSIAVMNSDGSGIRMIRQGIGISLDNEETRTSWSRNGEFIAFTQNKTIKWVAADGSASGLIISNGWDADWQH